MTWKAGKSVNVLKNENKAGTMPLLFRPTYWIGFSGFFLMARTKTIRMASKINGMAIATLIAFLLSNFIINDFGWNRALAGGQFEKLGLSEGHLEALLRVCFGLNLDCKVLSRTVNGKTELVTLIGENHCQGAAEFNAGMNLIKHYSMLGQEEASTNCISEHIPNFVLRFGEQLAEWKNGKTRENESFSFNHSFPDFNHDGAPMRIINLETGFRSKHPKHVIAQNALEGVSLATLGGLVVAGTVVSDRCLGETDYTGVVKGMGIALMGIGGIIFKSSFDEAKQFKNSGDRRMDITYEEVPVRDSNMANNIVRALVGREASIIGTMGAAHLYGVSKFLKAKGFTDHDQDLMDAYREMKLKYGTLKLRNTVFRNLTNLESRSFAGRAWLANVLESYPEDFSDDFKLDFKQRTEGLGLK